MAAFVCLGASSSSSVRSTAQLVPPPAFRFSLSAMAPALSSSSVNPNPDVITLSSSDDAPAPRLPSGKSGAATSKPAVLITLSSSDDAPGSKADVITLSSSDDIITLSSSDDEQEASSWKGSSSAGSKDGPAVLTSSSDSDDAELLLAKRRKIRPPLNVAWVFSDEVKILTALADERAESGQLPSSRSALDTIRRRRVDLERENPTARDVAKKVHNLKDRFKKVIAAGGPSDERRDRELYHLSSKVWPDELLPQIVHNSSASSSSSG